MPTRQHTDKEIEATINANIPLLNIAKSASDYAQLKADSTRIVGFNKLNSMVGQPLPLFVDVNKDWKGYSEYTDKDKKHRAYKCAATYSLMYPSESQSIRAMDFANNVNTLGKPVGMGFDTKQYGNSRIDYSKMRKGDAIIYQQQKPNGGTRQHIMAFTGKVDKNGNPIVIDGSNDAQKIVKRGLYTITIPGDTTSYLARAYDPNLRHEWSSQYIGTPTLRRKWADEYNRYQQTKSDKNSTSVNNTTVDQILSQIETEEKKQSTQKTETKPKVETKKEESKVKHDTIYVDRLLPIVKHDTVTKEVPVVKHDTVIKTLKDTVLKTVRDTVDRIIYRNQPNEQKKEDNKQEKKSVRDMFKSTLKYFS